MDNDSDNNNWKFTSRKFILAFMFTVAGIVALFIKYMDATSFNWLVGIVLTGHSAANIADKKFNG